MDNNGSFGVKLGGSIFRRAGRRFRSASDAKAAEIRKHHSFIWIQILRERRIVQIVLSLGVAQSIQLMQMLQHHLPSGRRHVVPHRNYLLLNVLPFTGRHALQYFSTLAPLNALLRRLVIPVLNYLPDLRLLLRTHALEALIILHETFLLLRRHVLQIFNKLRRKILPLSRISGFAVLIVWPRILIIRLIPRRLALIIFILWRRRRILSALLRYHRQRERAHHQQRGERIREFAENFHD
jgi:hypothetical protein